MWVGAIMTTTVGTVHDGKPGVYIGRPHKDEPWCWGNPFPVGAHYSRAESVAMFEQYFLNSLNPKAVWMREHIIDLKGQHLKCFCKPLACHGDVLAKYADIGLAPI